MSFNIFATAASLIAGILYFFPGEFLYSTLRGNVPGPVAIAVYFLGLAICVFLVIFLLSKLMGNYRHLHFTFGKLIAIVLVLTIVGVPLVSAGCELLYEIGIPQTERPKNYVFLIDNSGSMDTYDPTNQRFRVVEDVANSLPSDVNIGVYAFASETAEIYKTGQAHPGSISISPDLRLPTGGTSLYGCIQSATTFVVVTDGDPTDSDFKGAVMVCNQKNIAVSCVGFGDYRQSEFIDLANRTGGNVMPATDLSQLQTDVTELINKNPINRDLIGSRYDSTANSILYAILRVLFLCIIGLVFAYLKYLNAALKKFSLGFFLGCFALSLFGGIFVEVFYQLYWTETIGRLVLCLTFAFTPLLSNNYYAGFDSAVSKTTISTLAGSGDLYGGRSSAGSGRNYF